MEKLLFFWKLYSLPYRFFTCLCNMIAMPSCIYAEVVIRFYVVYLHIVHFCLLKPTVIAWTITHSSLSKDIHIWSSETCKYYSHGKKFVQNVIQLRILTWEDYPRLSGWIQCHHKDPYKNDAEASEKAEKVMWQWMQRVAGDVIIETEVRVMLPGDK